MDFCQTALKSVNEHLNDTAVMKAEFRSEIAEKIFEVLTSGELAARLKVKESWIIDQSKRCKTSDPIPVLRLGKHRRYRWGSPEMTAWLERRAGNTMRKAEPRKGGNV